MVIGRGDGLDILVVEKSKETRWPIQSPAMPTDIARYSIELFKPGGEGAGIEEILDRGTPTSRSPDQSTEPASSSIPGDYHGF